MTCAEKCFFNRFSIKFFHILLIIFFTYIFSWWNINWILLDNKNIYNYTNKKNHGSVDSLMHKSSNVGGSTGTKYDEDEYYDDIESFDNRKQKDNKKSPLYHHSSSSSSSSIYKEKVTEIVYPRDYREYHKRMFISMVTIQNSSSLLTKNKNTPKSTSNLNTDENNPTTRDNDKKANGGGGGGYNEEYKHVPQFSIELTKYHKDSIESRAFSHFLLLCADHLYKEDSDSMEKTLNKNNEAHEGDQQRPRNEEVVLHKQLLYCGDKLMSRSSIHCSLTYPIEYLQIQPNNEKIVSFLNLLIQKSLNKCQLLWFLKK